MRTLILTGGTIDFAFARDYIGGQRFDRVIAADRGLEFCREAGLVPDLILGDFDSAGSDALAYFSQTIPERIRRFPAEKDETDTELAVREALAMGSGSITVLGATGTRLDHVLGNIQILRGPLEAGVPCYLVDAHNRIRMVRDGCTIRREEQFGKYVSLIPFTESVTIRSLRGFAYEVADHVLESGIARGVSNEIAADEAEILLDAGVALVIESKD